MAIESAVGELTTTQVPSGTSGGSYVAIAPNLALSAGHSFVGFDEVTGQFQDFASGFIEFGGAAGIVDSVNYLRGYRDIQSAKTFGDVELDQEAANADLVTFIFSGLSHSTSELVGLGVFINPGDYIGREILASGFPSASPGYVSTAGVTVNVDSARAITSDVGLLPGMSGGPTYIDFLDEYGDLGAEFVIGVNSAGIENDPTSWSVGFTLNEFYAIADQVYLTGIDPNTLPRYLIVGSSTVLADAPRVGKYAVVGGTGLRDLIVGGIDHEVIVGLNSDDEILGGNGDDILIGDGAGLNASTAGNDVLHGGPGTDTVDYSAEDGFVNSTFDASDIQVGQPTASGEPVLLVTDTYGKTDTLISIEMLIAPGGGDVIDLTGFTGNIGIDGGGGNDTLTGGGGNDSLFGGEGLDIVIGGAGGDLLSAVHGPAFDYSMLSPPEIKAIFDAENYGSEAAASNHRLEGGAGADAYLIDYSESYAVSEDAANGFSPFYVAIEIDDDAANSAVFVRRTDTGQIESLTGAVHTIDNGFLNYIVTAIGNVYWIGRWGSDTLLIEIDDFTLWVESGGEEGEGHLLISVPSGAPSAFVNAPAPAFGLTTTPGGPVLVAGNGVTSSTSGNLTTVSGTSSADVVHAQGGNQLLNLSGGDDIAVTGGANDHLNGEAGVDSLDGGAGDDTLDGGAGADSLIGNDGFDYASYSSSATAVTVNYATGIFAGDIYSEIEGVIGSAFGDSISGDATANIFVGDDGDDTLKGLDGDDQLFAGIGDDRTEGGIGNDLAQGSNGNDTMLGGDGVDTLGGGSGGDLLRGEAGADLLLGSNGDDRLFGGDEADTLQGGGGRDTLWGDGGADRIEGGDQSDTVSYDTATSKVWVRLWAGDGLAGDALGDVLVEIEDLVGSAFGDTLVGDDSVNRIDGGEGGDLISGLNGDDILVGESGADTLTGGSGNEQFWFSVGGGADVVTDFSAGSAVGDVIRLFGRGAAVDTFAEVMALSSQQGANVVINFGGGDTITLQNVALGSLAANDFMFG